MELNPTLAVSTVGDVSQALFTPSGTRLVYMALQQGRDEIFSVAADGSQTAVKISANQVEFISGFAISPDGSRVVYSAVGGLKSTSTDGSSGPVQISGGNSGYQISPDGTRVVFKAGRLYSVPIDGSAPALALDPGVAGSVKGFEISPDGSRVVYVADQEVYGRDELYSVPIDGSASAIKLNASLATSGDVQTDFRITPDGSQVLYRADQDLTGVFELHVTPIDSSAPVKLHPSLASGRSVAAFAVSPDGIWAVYTADRDQDEVLEIFRVPVDASLAPKQLNPLLVNGGDVLDRFLISLDSTRVVYVADQDVDEVRELFSVPIEGSAAAVQLNAAFVSGGGLALNAPLFAVISPDSARVLYIADQEVDEEFELFSVPIDGSAAPVQLNGPLVTGGDVLGNPYYSVIPLRISPDSTRAFYLARQTDSIELFSVPIDASASSTRLSATLTCWSNVASFLLSPDGTCVAYLADQLYNDVIDLFGVPSDASAAPVLLNAPLSAAGTGRIAAYEVQGDLALYLADQEQDEVYELYGVDTAGGVPVKLNGPLLPCQDVRSFEIGPGGTRVVYGAGRLEIDLFSATTGGTGSVRLNGDLAPGAQITEYLASPDDAWVVYQAHEQGDVDERLRSTLSDGSAVSRPLSDGPVSSFAIAPGSDRVVYAMRELFAAPIDGSSAPVRLSPALPYPRRVRSLAVSPDGSRVVYLADQDQTDVVELFSVPIDGSAGSVQLNGTLAAGEDVNEFSVSPDGSRVVYRIYHVYSVSIDAGASPVQLTGTLVGGVVEFSISPDGQHVVFLADAFTSQRFILSSVPIDRHSPPVVLNGPLVAGGDVSSFRISPDSTRVAYVADQEADEQHLLHSAPIDAAGGSVLLEGSLEPTSYAFYPGGGKIAFLAPITLVPNYLFVVQADRPSTLTQLDDEAVDSFQLGSDGRVVYLATYPDYQLYSGKLLPPRSSAASPSATVNRTH